MSRDIRHRVLLVPGDPKSQHLDFLVEEEKLPVRFAIVASGSTVLAVASTSAAAYIIAAQAKGKEPLAVLPAFPIERTKP